MCKCAANIYACMSVCDTLVWCFGFGMWLLVYLWPGPDSLWWRGRSGWPTLRYTWSRSGWPAPPGNASARAGSSRWRRPPAPAGTRGAVLRGPTGTIRGEPQSRRSRCFLEGGSTHIPGHIHIYIPCSTRGYISLLASSSGHLGCILVLNASRLDVEKQDGC